MLEGPVDAFDLRCQDVSVVEPRHVLCIEIVSENLNDLPSICLRNHDMSRTKFHFEDAKA